MQDWTLSAAMSNDDSLRKHLLELLSGGQAHATFDQVVEDFPFEKTGVRPKGAPASRLPSPAAPRVVARDPAG